MAKENTNSIIRELVKLRTVSGAPGSYMEDLLSGRYAKESLAKKYKLTDVEQKGFMVHLRREAKLGGKIVYAWKLDEKLCQWYDICGELTEDEEEKIAEEIIEQMTELTEDEKKHI